MHAVHTCGLQVGTYKHVKRVSYVRTCLYEKFKCDVKYASESWNGLVRAVAMLYLVVVNVPRLSRREFKD